MSLLTEQVTIESKRWKIFINGEGRVRAVHRGTGVQRFTTIEREADHMPEWLLGFVAEAKRPGKLDSELEGVWCRSYPP